MSSLAIFGGTFDPIHNAHLSVARAAAEHFAIARILFIPASHPPHRLNGAVASYEDRFRMVALACVEDPRFEPSRLEQGSEASYSINTLEHVRAAAPADPLYFLIGADAFAEIGSWFRWREVISAVTFIVVSRPGATYEIPEHARVLRLENLEIPISSSEIRKLVKEGVSDLPVPGPVAEYIQERGLYR